MDLTVVVITRNEEAAIGHCLASLLERTAGLEREIILVDSASTDRTVEIASKYPVTIVRIDKCNELSPSAGRYLGTLRAKGKYLFFLDGDMIVIDGWLQEAFAQFKDENIAAVAGSLYRVFPGEELNYEHKNRYVLGKVPYLAGSGVYRRDVLGRTGTFNPFMKGEEERELGFRILQAGYTIVRLDVPMVYHMEKARTKSELDEKATHFTGIGQIFRHYGRQRISRDLLAANRNVFLVYLLMLLAVVLLVTTVAVGLMLPALIILGVGVSLVLLLVLFKGGNRVYLYLRSKLLILSNIIKGLGKGISDPGEFRAVTSVVSGLTARNPRES